MNETGYKGMQDASAAGSEFNAMTFFVRQLMNRNCTTTLVKVVSSTNSGGLSPVGFVDVTPLVQQVDGNGNVVAHGTIFNMPYQRVQGGENAVIIDPKAGDIGIAVFADRDISNVKRTKKAAPPGSARRFDMADGLYLGGVLNGVPSQYIQFSGSGIKVHSPTAITLDAPNIAIVATTLAMSATSGGTMTGDFAHGGGSLASNGIVVSTHKHSGVQSGPNDTGGPK
jgi:hypothetical protein